MEAGRCEMKLIIDVPGMESTDLDDMQVAVRKWLAG